MSSKSSMDTPPITRRACPVGLDGEEIEIAGDCQRLTAGKSMLLTGNRITVCSM
jgi:hypothetical protein